MSDNRPKRALIMKGGGVKGLAYVGAIEHLERAYDFNCFVGTSAGAITAILLGAGYSVEELKEILNEKNFATFFDAKSICEMAWNFIRYGGLHKADEFTNWMDELLSKKLDISTRVKMSDLPNQTIVYASRRNNAALRFDSSTNTNLSAYASFAARCSMSIPYVFTPQMEQGFRVYDGGIRNNFPVNEFLKQNPSTKFISLFLGPETYEPVKESFVLFDLISITLEGGDESVLREHRNHTVIIDTRPVGTLDFELTNSEKEYLLAAGEIGALRHLDVDKRNIQAALEKKEKLNKSVLKARHLRAEKRAKSKKTRLALLFLFLVVAFAAAGFCWNYLVGSVRQLGAFEYVCVISIFTGILTIRFWTKQKKLSEKQTKQNRTDSSLKYGLIPRLVMSAIFASCAIATYYSWLNNPVHFYAGMPMHDGMAVTNGEVTLKCGKHSHTTQIVNGEFKFENVSLACLRHGNLEFSYNLPGSPYDEMITKSTPDFDYRCSQVILEPERKVSKPRSLSAIIFDGLKVNKMAESNVKTLRIFDAPDAIQNEADSMAKQKDPIAFYFTLSADSPAKQYMQKFQTDVGNDRFTVFVTFVGNFDAGKAGDEKRLSGYVMSIARETQHLAKMTIHMCKEIPKTIKD